MECNHEIVNSDRWDVCLKCNAHWLARSPEHGEDYDD